MVHLFQRCLNSIVVPVVPESPFFLKGLDCYRQAVARVAAVVRKLHSPGFRYGVVDKALAVVIVSMRCSLKCSLQIVLVERAKIVIVESLA